MIFCKITIDLCKMHSNQIIIEHFNQITLDAVDWERRVVHLLERFEKGTATAFKQYYQKCEKAEPDREEFFDSSIRNR